MVAKVSNEAEIYLDNPNFLIRQLIWNIHNNFLVTILIESQSDICNL